MRLRLAATGHDTGQYDGTFFDLGPDGEVSIGDYCTLVGAMICSNCRVQIGDYAFIAHHVVSADSFAAVPFIADWDGETAATAGQPSEKSPILIEENVWIGARAVLLGGASVGAGAISRSASVIDFPVPPYAVVAGNPARIVKKTIGG